MTGEGSRRWALAVLAFGLMLGLASRDGSASRQQGVSRFMPRSAPAAWQQDASNLENGVVLGLFSRERGFDYGPKLREIRELGARWVQLLIVHYQEDRQSICITVDPLRTARPEEVARTIRQAHALGLQVLLLPIVVLDRPQPGDWRGNLEPASLTSWFQSYEGLLLGYARLAQHEGAEAMSIGSEFSSLEPYFWHWQPLIQKVRAQYGGWLGYSANWDHYRSASFYGDLDFVGLSAYFELTRDPDASALDLFEAWQPILQKLETWQAEHGKPLAFLELGYPSVDGGIARPWDHTRKGPIDLEEQRRAYQAAEKMLATTPFLSSAFFYEWWEPGGPEDPHYTPRGKPAEQVLRRIFGSPENGISVQPIDP